MNEPNSTSAADLPASTALHVPVRARRDGWTPARQDAFLACLGRTRRVGLAAGAAGMSRGSAYRLRDRADAAAFAAAWDAAITPPPSAEAVRIRDEARAMWDRAMNGRLVPIVRAGRTVGFRVRADNAALMTLVRRFDRAARGLDRGGPKRKPRS